MLTVEKQLALVALGLSPKKRAKLAELLLMSLENDQEAALAQLWADEAQARSKSLASGKLKTISVQKAFGFRA
jgi:hypothetical protein